MKHVPLLLILALFLLLAAQACMAIFQPVGRYQRYADGGALSILDTRTGTLYITADGKKSAVLTIADIERTAPVK